MSGVLLSVLMLIGSFGIQAAIDAYNRNQTSKKGLTQSELIREVNKSLAIARSKLGPEYNKLISKMNSLPGVSTSGAVRDLIQKNRKQMADKADKLSKTDSMVQSLANSIESQMTGYAYTSDSYKRSKAGIKERDTILKQSQDLKNMVENTLGGN